MLVIDEISEELEQWSSCASELLHVGLDGLKHELLLLKVHATNSVCGTDEPSLIRLDICL